MCKLFVWRDAIGNIKVYDEKLTHENKHFMNQINILDPKLNSYKHLINCTEEFKTDSYDSLKLEAN